MTAGLRKTARMQNHRFRVYGELSILCVLLDPLVSSSNGALTQSHFWSTHQALFTALLDAFNPLCIYCAAR
jgi:hypothetical protein